MLKKEYTVRSLQLYTYHEGGAKFKLRRDENLHLQTKESYIHVR